MVLNTQLQLKWPNHSTHLLTGLKALFKNEQLVDCTLKCNKHSLKVHKSVLAACSPYFERKLENNPSIVVEDVQFSILQSLIEFMYYGETRISEDNLTSLIEAAKLFEVKGLSEMDLIPSNENSIILSVVAVNGNGGNRAVIKSSSERMENLVFDSHSLPAQLNSHKNAQQCEPDVSTTSLTLADTDLPEIATEESPHLIEEDSRHTNRNFVVTPPQTESAQILLSLACPFNQQQQQTVNGAYNGGDAQEDENNGSLLEKLLTREPASQTHSHYYGNYKYAGESSSSSTEATKNQNDTDTIQPEAILEYPFLVQTNEGLVDAAEMLNVFDHGGVFDPNSVGKTAEKIVPKESVLITEEVGDTTSKPLVENSELQHIKQSTEEELKNDPEAVVLYKTNEFGQVEQYVLSSSDILALKAMNERLKQKRPQNFDQVGSPHIEVEFPASEGNTSLITRIFSNDDKVEKAISKLPFRRTSSNRSTNVESVDSGSSSSTSGDRLLDDTPLTVDAHHHENMFEELDNQFNLDCSIDNIQQEYGAYEEASKHESQLQLDHNYYANAMKDGDEECAVVISGDNYDLGSVMLIQEPSETDYNLVALSNNNNNSSNNNNIKRKDSAANVAASANFQIFNADGGDVYLNGERTSRCNGVVDKPIFNGKCDLIISNDDLISPVLTTTVMNTTTAATTTSSMARAMNCVPDLAPGVKSSRGAKTKRRNSLNDAVAYGSLTLPFKKVKNAVSRNGTACAEKKLYRRTYRRRSTSLNEAPSESRSLNGEFQEFDLEGSDASLVEEVIVELS